MSDNVVRLILEGADSDSGHVDLSLFLRELEIVRAAITCLDKELSYNDKARLKLLVTDLSHSSPAATTLTPVPISKDAHATATVMKRFYEVVEAVVSGDIPENISYRALEALNGFGSQVGSKLKFSTLVIDNRRFDIAKSFSRNVASALEKGDTCFGSVEGALEQINVHGRDKFFTIYPDIGPQKVRCIFPDKLHKEAVSSIERRVEVSGLLRFRPGAPYPHEILVDAIYGLSEDKDLPTFDDLLGVAPLNDDRSSEEIIGDIRNGWH